MYHYSNTLKPSLKKLWSTEEIWREVALKDLVRSSVSRPDKHAEHTVHENAHRSRSATRRYKRVVTAKRAAVAVVLCWAVAFVVGLMPMLGWNNLQKLKENDSLSSDLVITCQFENVISMEYMVYFNFFGWVLPPLLLMLIIYAEIFYMIHKQLSKKVTGSNADPSKYYGKELNLAKSLALVLALFALSWLPLHILNCITLFCPRCQKPMFLIYIAILLTHANSAVNPIVYAFRIKKFHSAFLTIWKQYLCCKEKPQLQPQGDGHVPSPPEQLQEVQKGI
ncbi:adenosine receptor A1-like isoform X2 [Scleropages formosus]|uniref:adenosine receptor A1-like isoform X2 n=1 Tax=Scleropages formosus TaxID=113540 RepID=UPI000878DBE6|nr:adenosine receptor A1-like isoform X2 [Scleropages formosus]